jgi:hypothetical protein
MKSQCKQGSEDFKGETIIGAGVEALETHFLQLTVDRFDLATMGIKQGGVCSAVAAHVLAIARHQAYTAIDVGQEFILLADIAFVSDDDTAFRQAGQQILYSHQFIPVGGQHLERNRDTLSTAHQVQLPAKVMLVATGAVAVECSPLHFATPPRAHALTHRQRAGIDEVDPASLKGLTHQPTELIQHRQQAMQTAVEARDAHLADVAQPLQNTQGAFMMVLKGAGGDNGHCQNLGITTSSTHIRLVLHGFQQIINHHINRYNIVVVHGLRSFDESGWYFHSNERGLNDFN